MFQQHSKSIRNLICLKRLLLMANLTIRAVIILSASWPRRAPVLQAADDAGGAGRHVGAKLLAVLEARVGQRPRRSGCRWTRTP